MPRPHPSILHLDMDAFYAAVEKRDKPSLASRPVVVGGVGGRGVVATCSYEARAFGVRSAMSMMEARKRLPGTTAYLSPRFEAYKQSSDIVMSLLRAVSPLVEPVSLDEAFVDLAAGDGLDLSVDGVTALAEQLREQIRRATGGLTASVGVGTSKIVAKVGSDACKPNGLLVVAPGQELALLHPLPVRALWGVGPATTEKLARINVTTVEQLSRLEESELVGLFGQSHGRGLYALARADDDRQVQADREAKSVSAEDTFDVDVTDPVRIGREIEALSGRVAARLSASGTAGRTVTVKVRRHDFTTFTRSATLPQPTDDVNLIVRLAKSTLAAVPVDNGFRLLGVGVSGLSDHVQTDLFSEQEREQAASEVTLRSQYLGSNDSPALFSATDDPSLTGKTGLGDHGELDAPAAAGSTGRSASPARSFPAGRDVQHPDFGAGWVWGSGHGRVTVRFEGPDSPVGPVRTFRDNDPLLQPAPPPAVVPLD